MCSIAFGKVKRGNLAGFGGMKVHEAVALRIFQRMRCAMASQVGRGRTGDHRKAAQGAGPSQLAIAWVLAQVQAQGLDMVPLVGSRTLPQLEESIGTLKVNLSADDMQKLNAALLAAAVAGTRYDAYQMGHLDSEKQQVQAGK